MRKFSWQEAIIVGVLLLLTATRAVAMNADQLNNRIAEMLQISENMAQFSASGEQWVDKTRKTLLRLTGKIGVSEMIKLGTPAYRHIRDMTERGGIYILPELIAGELSKVAEYGGAELRFTDGSDRYAKRILIEAASFLPAEMVRRIPILEARTVIGRGWFRQYSLDRVFIKANNVKISLHELGHALEHSIGHLRLLRNEFYENRTQGNQLRRLNRFLLPFGYRPYEKYRAGLVSRYMGKEGGVELYSCGLEYVFFNSHDIWRRDPEMTKFILGTLIFYGISEGLRER